MTYIMEELLFVVKLLCSVPSLQWPTSWRSTIQLEMFYLRSLGQILILEPLVDQPLGSESIMLRYRSDQLPFLKPLVSLRVQKLVIILTNTKSTTYGFKTPTPSPNPATSPCLWVLPSTPDDRHNRPAKAPLEAHTVLGPALVAWPPAAASPVAAAWPGR